VAHLGQPPRGEGYERFFGFAEAPFSLAPNPRFLFESSSHATALAQVAYAMERREPLVVITGEIGTGKTLLCRTVLQRLERKTFVSVVNDPLLGRDDLLKQLLEDFGVISKDRTRLAPTSRHALIAALQDFLASLIPLRAHAVVIIDEAQHLQPGVLEEIRLLSNIDDDRGTMLQIILVGQNDLEPLLSRPELRQFQQRVSRRLRLEALDRDEVAQYIEHRLAVARGERAHAPGGDELARAMAEWHEGARETPDRARTASFTPSATEAIARLSGGVPRVINLICDRALEAAYALQSNAVDEATVATAARALGLAGQVARDAPADGRARPAVWPPETIDRGDAAVAAAPRARDIGAETQPPREALPALAAVPAPVEAEPRADGVEHAVDRIGAPVPVVLGAPPPPPSSLRKIVLIGGTVAAGFAAIWLGAMALNPPSDPQPGRESAPTSPAAPPARPAREPARAPAPEAASAPAEAPKTPAAPPPRAGLPPSDTAAPPAGERFEIVVASFRTESRAAAVADGVAALGIPFRRRETGGWRQVLAGPFSSRTQAEAAQQRLADAGFSGTQLVASAR
jgi:type II secretory pathway predicted ATPase ExeA/cell division protein FtsN